ncbi:SusC/RagA family TonB-linked outer membrane protein [Mucilaginibacter sp. OK098]|uniref:SusC/RagA family TonB-linked outer membrane protein n=1 Tax=Mucilaginibacter sp. OK098 TaxID=1855297 RepID=UPI000920EC1F|nr:TonB-dependent receptor [Mucilaginibacter sp. OK098]SHL97684.1 TonB-linked outer membrane protein, SusC/RagA family [Mucilaginibacter sp. OK098]
MEQKILISSNLSSGRFRAIFKPLALILLPFAVSASTPAATNHSQAAANSLSVLKKTAITVKGNVVDASNGQPLIGVSVAVKGTPIATITDSKGNFQLSNLPDNAVLVFSYISFDKLEVAVKGQNNFEIKLKPSMQTLNEIVVVGYGTQKKANLTGSVGTVNTQDLESRPLTNSSQALQGTVSGVYALQSSGKPGDDKTVIDIRGVGTFGDNSPLVLVDGFPGNIGDVNPNDLQSISVLKDAASSAIYGSRAANGVILITTKRGSAGKTRVNYSVYAGVQSPTRLPGVLNSIQYTALYNEAAVNSGQAAPFSDATIAKYAAHNDPMFPDINYFKVYYNNANIQNHRFSVTGGNDNANYAFMLGHLNQDGILVGTNYKKTDFRLNLDTYHLKDKRLRVSGNISGNYGLKTEPTDLWSAEWYSTLAPIHPLKDANGNWVSVNGERNFYGEIKEGSTNITKGWNFNGQAEAEYKLSNDLSAQVTYGYGAVYTNGNAFHANVTLQNQNGTTTQLSSNLNVTNEIDLHSLLTGLLKYNKTLGRHSINLLGGYSEEEFSWDWQSGYRASFVNNTQRVLSLGDAATQTNNAGSYDLGLRSFFGRFNYSFDGKYLFEANVRRDGSSRFAQGKQWGTFPSFSGGWVISKENFMKDVKWLDFAKLRASWGQLGNQNVNNYYNGSDILSSGQNYSFGGNLNSGAAITAMTNKNLTWETAQQLDFGIDVSLHNNIEITADYFDKKTKNLLLTQPIPLTIAESAPLANAGEVENKGFEIGVSYKKTFDNGIKLRTSLNLSHIVNKITAMNVPQQFNSPKAIVVGSAINSFYGYQMTGIYQISDFTWQNNSDPATPYANRVFTLKPGVVKESDYNAQPGDIKYADLNGDGIVDMNHDRKIIGKQFPDITYAFNFNIAWKGFDLGAFLQGVKGIQGYTYYEIATPFSGFANTGSWWLNRWTPTNPSNTMPRLTLDGNRNNIHSSFYVEDASYLRVKNIELGYTLSPTVIKRIGLSSLRLYVNVQNAFTFTKFKGFDPEQTTDQTRAEAFPQVRVMTAGLNVNF